MLDADSLWEGWNRDHEHGIARLRRCHWLYVYYFGDLLRANMINEPVTNVSYSDGNVGVRNWVPSIGAVSFVVNADDNVSAKMVSESSHILCRLQTFALLPGYRLEVELFTFLPMLSFVAFNNSRTECWCV